LAAMSADGFSGLINMAARLLCLLGFHDFVVISRTFGFGASGDVEKVECRRCGHITARKP
jgi:hypothetical protein